MRAVTKQIVRTTAVLLGFMLLSSFSGTEQVRSSLGKSINDFQLPSVDGRTLSLASYPDARGFIVVFSCNHCPFAKLYTERLNKLHTSYSAKNVPLLVINPMDTLMYEEEGMHNMQERAKQAHFLFPYLIDASQSVARNFGARHTPQAYVVWKQDGTWVVRYAGAIDDNGEHPEIATNFIGQAVDALLSNQEPARKESLTLGCRITYRKK